MGLTLCPMNLNWQQLPDNLYRLLGTQILTALKCITCRWFSLFNDVFQLYNYITSRDRMIIEVQLEECGYLMQVLSQCLNGCRY